MRMRYRFLSVLAVTAVAFAPAMLVTSPVQAAPSDYLTISDAGNWEGGNVTFTVTYAGAGAASFDFGLVASDGNAMAATKADAAPDDADNTDFPATKLVSGNFSAGTTVAFTGPDTITVSAQTNADSDIADEDFKLQAMPNTPLAGVPVTGNGQIWAVADSDYPTFTLTGPPDPVPETASQATVQKTVTVTAQLDKVLPHPVTIPVSTVAGSAVPAGGELRDFTALPAGSAITIPAGQSSGIVDVSLWDDSLHEAATQTFTVTSGTTYGAKISGSAATVTIADDDPVPMVSIADARPVMEGESLNFPVVLSVLSELPVTIMAATADGTNRADSKAAIAGADYTPKAKAGGEKLTIPPYAQSQNFSVKSLTDGVLEGPENVRAMLNGMPTNADLGAPATAYGIINDAAADKPTITVSTAGPGNSLPSGSSFLEGAGGEVVHKIAVTLTLAPVYSTPVTIAYAFKDGTATNGVDYRGTAGTLTIPAGSAATNLEIPVTIIGDRIKEGVSDTVTPSNPDYETFTVNFTSSTGTIAATAKTIRITEDPADDVTPTWSVGDASAAEGNAGTAVAKVPVTLSVPSATATTFSFLLNAGTAAETGVAAGDNDYDYPANRILTIPAGSTTGFIEVPINSDTVYERDETVLVTPTPTSANVSNSQPAGTRHSGTLTITNDDVKPSITFSNLSTGEGGFLRVSGTINGLSQYDYTVGFAVAAAATDPATPGTDFDIPAGLPATTLTITRGTTGALPAPFPFDIYLPPDTIDEPTEAFTVTATETTPVPTGFATSVGTYKITDDPADLPPAASVSDETIDEGAGSVDVHVTLTQVGDTTATEQRITIPYRTVDGSAKAGHDYANTKGTLTVEPGQTTATIKVPIIQDKLVEVGESFFVKLSAPTSPVGATIAKGSGEIVIGPDGGDTPGGPGSPGEPGAPTIEAPAKIVGGIVVPITGQAATGATVELWGAPLGSGRDLEKITTTEADEDGRYSFSRWIGRGYRLAVRAGGLMSGEVSVTVQQDPVFVASSPSRGRLYLAVQGNPRGPAQIVIVQKLVNGKWVNTWRGTTASNNLWKVTVNQPSRSTVSLRAFVAGYTPHGLLPGYTTTHRVTIR